MLINSTTAQGLQDMLDVCIQNQPGSGKHGYLGFRKVKDKVYLDTFLSKERLENLGYEKASLHDIQNISQYILFREKNTPVPNKILQSLHTLAENKNKKLNSLTKKVGRFFLSILKYVLYATGIGIPFGIMIRKKQGHWNSMQMQINAHLHVTSPVDREIASTVKNCNSKTAQKKLKLVVSLGIEDDLKVRLAEEQIKKFVDFDNEDNYPVILESLRRDHTRGCVAQYILEDEETGFTQPIVPFSKKDVSVNEYFGQVIRKIDGFNKQGNLQNYSSYVQALMCQNILQGLIYKQKSELQAGAWQTDKVDPRRVVKPDYSHSKPCEVGLADIKVAIKKGKGSKPRTIHVEGTVELKSNLMSSRTIDPEGKNPIDFEEPSRNFTARISFDLHPKSFEGNTFTLSKFSVHTTLAK